MLRRLIPDTFLLLLVGTVALATFLPARGGFSVAVSWAAQASIVLLFFFHGARLARQQVIAGLAHWRLHFAILGSTFVMFPIAGLAARFAVGDLLPPGLAVGIVFLATLPSTVQSSIAFVGMAQGNVAAAVAAASASQMLGIVVTPLLMWLLAGIHGAGGGLGAVGAVALQILLPFVLGHLSRPLTLGWVERNRRLVAMTDRSTILLAVYSAFSAAVVDGLWHRLPLPALALLTLACVALLAIGFGFTWGLGHLAGFDRADRVALLFCGTKKSLIQGVPIARVLFPAAQAGPILLPIMIFHQLQLMVGAVIARHYAVGPR